MKNESDTVTNPDIYGYDPDIYGTDLERWGEETKLWESPDYGHRQQELPEDLMQEARVTVRKTRVVLTKLSNMQLACLERACVEVHRFSLWNKIITEMIKRPDFIPERGTAEEQTLIRMVPNPARILFDQIHPVGPYKSSYSAYKAGTSPEHIQDRKLGVG
jgi:hypothetical protein